MFMHQQHMNVHRSFIQNNQNWKQLRCHVMNEELSKLWYIHAMECLLSNKRCQLGIRNNLDVSQGNYAKWKRANPKRLHTA